MVVTGDPGLVLQMGDQARSADLFSVSAEWAIFRYFVKASDRDDDGIGIPANAVRLNRGSIRDSGGNDADLTHEAVPDDPQRKVDRRLDAIPTITQVSLGSPRDRGDTFGRGEPLLVRVQFSELVDVTGAPQLTIQVGTQARQADLHRRLGTSLLFEYIVQSSDVDADGYSVPADALSLNGGSIRDADGNDADLTQAAVAADLGKKVNGASGVPTVARIYLNSPASQDTYVAGERLSVLVRFSRGVHVKGTPQLTIQVGAQARRADHLPRLRAAQLLPQGNGFHVESENAVYFEYVVQPSDVDDDGISVPANALTLNGGSIRAVDDNSDASLSHNGLADDPRRKVDGTRGDDQAPTVAGLWVEPPVHGTFGGGDAIETRVWFNEGMTMTGAPRLALRIGAETRFATFKETLGSDLLRFEYVVAESDRDDDGISIAADAFDLNGGTIQDNAGNDANLDLGYRAFDNDPNYKVNGRLTPVPADEMPSFGEAVIDDQRYTVNTAITDLVLPAATGGDGALTYSLAPALPAGLTFVADTRTLSGTPTESQDATEFSYTVTDEDGDTATLMFNITVAPADEMPAFGEAVIDDQRYTVNTAITDLVLPAATGGDGALTYSLAPALPAGLTFVADTRTLSGTPTESQDATEFSYTVTDEDGDTATLMFNITVAPADEMPAFGEAVIDDQRYTVNTAITDLVLPAATGGDGGALTYSLAPALPAGLTFVADTRTLSGTPTESQDATEFSYTVTDEDGDTATLMFNITVAPADEMPAFGEAVIDDQRYTVNTAITDLVLPAATGGDGALTYSLAPALPAGLTFVADTRTLSGTPTESQDATEFSYTVTDEDGDTATLMFNITVALTPVPALPLAGVLALGALLYGLARRRQRR